MRKRAEQAFEYGLLAPILLIGLLITDDKSSRLQRALVALTVVSTLAFAVYGFWSFFDLPIPHFTISWSKQ